LFSDFRELSADLITAALAVVILKMYFETFFEKEKRTIYSVICWVFYFLWQIVIGRIEGMPPYGNVVISVVLVSLICISAYKGGFWQKVLFSVLINALWMFLEFLVGYLFLLNGNFETTLNFLGPVFSELLALFLIIGLRVFFQNESIQNISNKNHFLLLLIPLGSMFVVYNIFMLNIQLGKTWYIEKSITSSIIVFLINAAIFRLYLSLSKEKELQKYNTVYEQQIELCNQHMREKEAVMLRFRNARHDMKQHLIVLLNMLEHQETEQAADYLRKQVHMDALEDNGISRTDNIVVDSLVNAKYSVALKAKINFTADIHIPMQLSYSGADLCILLGNILDNAIEASRKIPEEQRNISFFMKYESNVLILTVRNAFDGKLRKNRDGRMISLKEEPVNHGIGLESVRKVAEKYHGSVVTEVKQNIFIIKVILCDLSVKLSQIS